MNHKRIFLLGVLALAMAFAGSGGMAAPESQAVTGAPDTCVPDRFV
jgi:hypothetical protein